jgi:hypothetical protein
MIFIVIKIDHFENSKKNYKIYVNNYCNYIIFDKINMHSENFKKIINFFY